MFEHAEDYLSPRKSFIGRGADIKWCSRCNGRKKCCLCGKYVEFKEWSVSWMWHYLVAWSDRYAGLRYLYERVDTESWSPWAIAGNFYNKSPQPFPKRYSTPGLGEYKFRKLLLKGCNDKKPCICIKLIQRGSWYCPLCFETIKTIAKNYSCDIHDVIASDLEEVRRERLYVLLAQLK